jgi:sulfatase modifying factor 1
MSCVSWPAAEAYCGWVGRRLPTEAEWERAARGTDGATFPWGNKRPNCQLANYKGCGGSTVPVKKSRANGKAPLHLAGNIAEWVADYYSSTYYRTGPSTDPKGPTTGRVRVIKGGSYQSAARYIRGGHRRYAQIQHSSVAVGFRCAVSK